MKFTPASYKTVTKSENSPYRARGGHFAPVRHPAGTEISIALRGVWPKGRNLAVASDPAQPHAPARVIPPSTAKYFPQHV